jgi:hypothetical protein
VERRRIYRKGAQLGEVGASSPIRASTKEVPVRRKILAFALTVGALTIPASSAIGDPDFGPGNSSKGPNDGGAKCHAPNHGTGAGSNEPVPGCKG